MPNRNYLKGRRAEFLFVKELRAWGYEARRTAGSHGPYDIIALDQSELFNHPVRLIQLKSVKTEQQKDRILKTWRAPLRPCPHYRQEIIVRWNGKWWGVPPEHRHEHNQAHGHASHV